MSTVISIHAGHWSYHTELRCYDLSKEQLYTEYPRQDLEMLLSPINMRMAVEVHFI